MKLRIDGPYNDGFGNIWLVLGPRGGEKAWFYTKSAAKSWILKGETE